MPYRSGKVNIVAQDLEKLIIRPNFGTIKAFSASGKVNPNTSTLAWYITGPGIHFGVYFWASSTGIMDDDYLHFDIDGSIGDFPPFKLFLENYWIHAIGAEPTGCMYDAVNFKIAGYAGAGKTWNNYHSFYYVETYGRTPIVNCNFIYQIF